MKTEGIRAGLSFWLDSCPFMIYAYQPSGSAIVEKYHAGIAKRPFMTMYQLNVKLVHSQKVKKVGKAPVERNPFTSNFC